MIGLVAGGEERGGGRSDEDKHRLAGHLPHLKLQPECVGNHYLLDLLKRGSKTQLQALQVQWNLRVQGLSGTYPDDPVPSLRVTPYSLGP